MYLLKYAFIYKIQQKSRVYTRAYWTKDKYEEQEPNKKKNERKK